LVDELLRQAAKAACHWPKEIRLSFNISPSQLKNATLAVRILSIPKESGLLPRRLEIELTESALVSDLHGAQEVLATLREAGVRIAVDDFGTGYSSLNIDRSLDHEPTLLAARCRLQLTRTFLNCHGSL
jgi:predicted signal transduction protein with EAL and GGDEF domain